MQNFTDDFSAIDTTDTGHGIKNGVGLNGDFGAKVAQFVCHLRRGLVAEVSSELLDVADARIGYFTSGDLYKRAERYIGIRGYSWPITLRRLQLIHYIFVD